MDSGISDMLNSVLSNPDALNKIMAVMPAVAQMMNGGGSDNINSPNSLIQKKIVETTTVNENKSDSENISAVSTESLMANAEVMAAFKNLITVLNAESTDKTAKIENNDDKPEEKPDSVMASSMNMDSIANILGSMAKPQGSGSADSMSNMSIDNGRIEKTLDTLKNFTSATSPESDHRLKLLLSLKPFLKDGRKTKIDSAIKYMNAAKIINMFGKNGFV